MEQRDDGVTSEPEAEATVIAPGSEVLYDGDAFGLVLSWNGEKPDALTIKNAVFTLLQQLQAAE